jgi:hypothetical protein
MGSALTGEGIRQAWMSLGLVAASLAGGASVSNERGVFIPIAGIERAIAATFRAFAAIAAPAPITIDSLYVLPQRMDQIGRAPRLQRVVDMRGVNFHPYSAAPVRVPSSSGPLGQPTQPGGADAEIAAAAQAAQQALAPEPQVQLAQLGNTPFPIFRGPDVFGGGGVPGNETTPTDPDDPDSPDNPDTPIAPPVPPVVPVPEPATWAIMIAGFGLMGAVQRSIALRERNRARRRLLNLD